MRFMAFLAACLLTLPTLVAAQSVGLIITNDAYQKHPNVRYGNRIKFAIADFEKSGMQVVQAVEANSSDLDRAVSEFGQMVANAETVFVGLSGRFVHTATETYYLPSDGEAGPLATLSKTALPVSTVLAWLASKPGEAVLLLSTTPFDAKYGPFIQAGIGELNIPQGVTVIVSGPYVAADLLSQRLSQPGKPFVGAAIQNPNMSIHGYAPRTMVLLDGRTAPPQTADSRVEEIRSWREASGRNTIDAYEAYLSKHPNGQFAAMAQSRIRSLTDTPQARAERAEQSLDLSRNARRAIQRNLSLLGFDTRGIDGIFGRGTRAAIERWQSSERFDPTGYVTREQIAVLTEQAERRARELEEEAEERRREKLAQDLDYWDQTGALGDEAGLRAYLNRFPDGEYAELANERLAVIEDRKRTRASRNDRQFWDQATEVNTVDSYRAYLIRSPNGAFKEEAQARIAKLQNQNENAEENAKYARAEAAMNLSPRTRQVVESRLKALGLRPGPVDGVFDDDTRRAIRRYQSARNMNETGYLSEAVVVQLMADTVRSIFR